MHWPKPTAFLLSLILSVPGLTVAREQNTLITGTAAGPQCGLVAVGVSRYFLSYPVLGALGIWSPGVPAVHDLTGEIYVYHADTRELQRVVSIKAPSRWKDDTTRFSIYPRILPNKELVFMLRGCPKDNQNCQEARYFRVAMDGKQSEMTNWPEVSQEGSKNLRQCTSYLTYQDGQRFVSIGPTGGPWRPILRFENHELVRVNEATDTPISRGSGRQTDATHEASR